MATFVTGRVIQDGTVTTNDLQQGLVIPPGAVMSFAMSAAPVGWLACDGTSKVVSDFQPLFAAIGYTYGGSGSNFNVPNLQGQFVRGLTTNFSTASRDPLSASRVLGNVQAQDWKSIYFTNTYNTYVHDGYWGKNAYPNWYSPGNGGMFTGYWASVGTPPGTTNPPYYATATSFSWDDSEIRPVNIALLYCIKY